MQRLQLSIALLVAGFCASALASVSALPSVWAFDPAAGAAAPVTSATITPSSPLSTRPHFPDARTPTTPDPSVSPFVLSQDYPTSWPVACAGCDWLTPNPTSAPLDYLQRVLNYAYEGNIDPNVDWRVEQNPIRRWYHVPWLHWTDKGREWRHGLTREANTTLGGRCEQTWAIGFYSDFGGYTVGQVWASDTPSFTGYTFPVGTVAVKLLFTTATDVPFLDGAPEWTADVHAFTRATHCPRFLNDFEVLSMPPTPREPHRVKLLQVDVAVRDDRAPVSSTTGWVFGTFVYRAGSKNPQCHQACWENVVPVGLMWGNSPGITPPKATATAATGTSALTEQWINPAPIPPPTFKLGWAGRLNGPVDNPESACLSCHSTAQFHSTSMMPTPTMSDEQRLHWFRDIKPGAVFDPVPRGIPPATPVSLDYSLQLAISVRSWAIDHRVPTPSPLSREVFFAEFGPDMFRPGAEDADDGSEPQRTLPAEEQGAGGGNPGSAGLVGGSLLLGGSIAWLARRRR
jgi:hypothetical protein